MENGPCSIATRVIVNKLPTYLIAGVVPSNKVPVPQRLIEKKIETKIKRKKDDGHA